MTRRTVVLPLAALAMTTFALPACSWPSRLPDPSDTVWKVLGVAHLAFAAALAALVYFPLRWRARRRQRPEGRYWLTWIGCIVGVVPGAAVLFAILAGVSGPADPVAAPTAVPASGGAGPDPSLFPEWAPVAALFGLLVVIMALTGVAGFFVWRRSPPAPR